MDLFPPMFFAPFDQQEFETFAGGYAETCFPDIEPTIKAANEEFDVAKRREMLKEINRYYHDAASAIFLYEEVQIDAVSNKVKGYTPNNRIINWADLTVDG